MPRPFLTCMVFFYMAVWDREGKVLGALPLAPLALTPGYFRANNKD